MTFEAKHKQFRLQGENSPYAGASPLNQEEENKADHSSVSACGFQTSAGSAARVKFGAENHVSDVLAQTKVLGA